MTVNKGFKRVSVVMMALLVSASTTISAFAADEKRIDIVDSDGGYVTMTNITGETSMGQSPVYHAGGSVQVTFHANDFSDESIQFFPQGKMEDGQFSPGSESEEVKFEQKKYVYYFDDTKQVQDDFCRNPMMYATM
jgi:hypothetical protein